jgi:hypothetical protein
METPALEIFSCTDQILKQRVFSISIRFTLIIVPVVRLVIVTEEVTRIIHNF